MMWFFIFVGIAYAVLISCLSIGFYKVDVFKPTVKKQVTKFSVIVPFRNESEHLPNLLNSILKLDYPKNLVEFIFVDDDSTDDSIKVIQEELNTISQKNEITRTDIRVLKNIRTSNSPKKDAITHAVSLAKNNWIITTDADCILPKKWLQTLDYFIQEKKPTMVVAPVNYSVKNTFLEQFQLIDFMSLQGTTIGSFGSKFPFLCNGANLTYTKETFLAINGFEGNTKIASGDDIFLFEKYIQKNKKSVKYLKSKDAIVTTLPVNSWKHLTQQRIRWAAKTSNLNSKKVKIIGFLILFTNLTVVYFLFFGTLKTGFVPLFLKMIIDLCLFIPTFKFFNHKNTWVKWYFFSSFLYPFFSIGIIFLSLTTTFTWKERSFKK